MAVSNPPLGTEPLGSSDPGSVPLSTCHTLTSVAPFQLTYTAAPAVVPSVAMSGTPDGAADHGERNAR